MNAVFSLWPSLCSLNAKKRLKDRPLRLQLEASQRLWTLLINAFVSALLSGGLLCIPSNSFATTILCNPGQPTLGTCSSTSVSIYGYPRQAANDNTGTPGQRIHSEVAQINSIDSAVDPGKVIGLGEASATSDFGVNRATAKTISSVIGNPYSSPYQWEGQARAISEWGELLSISGPPSSFAQVTASGTVHGLINVNPTNFICNCYPSHDFIYTFDVNGQPTVVVRNAAYSNTHVYPPTQLIQVPNTGVGGQYFFSVPWSYSFKVSSGTSFSIGASLDVRSYVSADVDFGSTATIDSVVVPTGFSLSDSDKQLQLFDGVYKFQAAMVPEPETHAMLLAGLVAIGAAVRRRTSGGSRSRKLDVMLGLAGTVFVCGAQAANLATNGSFETGTLSGWSLVSGSAPIRTDYGATDGSHAAILGFGNNAPPNFDLRQSIGTIAGVAYRVDFDWGPSPNKTAQAMRFSVIGGVGDLAAINLSGVGNFPTPFAHYSVSFVADSLFATLKFVDASAASFQIDQVLDKVSVTAVPEPETHAMLLAGLVAIGTIVLRRSS